MAKRQRSNSTHNPKIQQKRAKAKEEEDSNLFSGWSSLRGFETNQHQYNPDEDDDEEEEAKDGEEEEELAEYELKARKFKADEEEENNFERLPIKSSDGQIHRIHTKDPELLEKKKKFEKEEIEEESSESESESEEEEEESEDEDEEDEKTKSEKEKEEKPPVLDAQEFIKIQELIAEVAEQVIEDPEENISQLRQLGTLLVSSPFYKVKQLVILSLVTIFKSIIPGYHIRPLTELEKTAKTSKEVAKLRNFEQSLIRYYKNYIDMLAELTKGTKKYTTAENPEDYILATTSIRAACELLISTPHFNFRNEIIDILVHKISSRNHLDKPFAQVIKTIQEVFKQDEEGHVSLELVRRISKMAKVRKYKIHESVMELLLYLRLLTELNAKGGLDSVSTNVDDDGVKLKRKDRVHLTKRQRKIRKENKEIEKEMKRVEATVSAEEREKAQAETLKLVFILYFNILKERVNHLMAITLEGLAKFAHLINSEFFGDLLEVLRELILDRQVWEIEGEFKFKESATREALLCILTAFALLNAQEASRVSGESMNLDLSFFINHFYSCLFSISLNPDIEYSPHKTLRLKDPMLLNKVRESGATEEEDQEQYLPKRVNISTEMEMVIEIFNYLFFQHRPANNLRAEAFTKKLWMACLQFPEKSCLSGLKTLAKLNRRYSVLAGLYSTEDRITNGVFRLDVENDPQHANAEAATIWESVLLEKHYCPKVAKAAALVPKTSIAKK